MRTEDLPLEALEHALVSAKDQALAGLIHARPAWPPVTEVEFATMNWVHWWNNQRLHQALDYATPIEVDTAYAQIREPSLGPAETTEQNPGGVSWRPNQSLWVV